jgi:trehalose 6-phosphate phosphatase
MVAPQFEDPSAYAFFLDFDGTLAEIAQSPDAVEVSQSARSALGDLHGSARGAVAIITGREIGTIDHFLAPLKLPIAGVHGFERRSANGATVKAATTAESAPVIEEQLGVFVKEHPGLILEKKSSALSLHYRERPDLEGACLSRMDALAGNSKSVVLTRGKMVVEARFHRATKGTAIMDFLQEEPFRGRIPVAAGDDETDEDAFAAVNAASGLSIKVGPGATRANYQVRDVTEFLHWLRQAAGGVAGEIIYG